MAKPIVINDPVLGRIVLLDKDQWVKDLLQTREMQRMRFVLQLGATHYIYPSATHTRFVHQLGTFEITRRIIDNFKKNSYTMKERNITCAAALLHDIGHGPTSHSFEAFTGTTHEHYTCSLIADEKSEVHAVLKKHGIMPADVIKVLRHEMPVGKQWMTQLVSSQLDADRLDYLMRDSYYTATSYGIVDRDFIISNAHLREGKLVFAEKILPAIENYLLSRFHMYTQIYHSKSAYAWEALVGSILRRMKDLYGSYKFADVNGAMRFYEVWLSGSVWDNEQYLRLNDSNFHLLLSGAESETDKVLSRLGYLYNRRINFKAVEWSGSVVKKLTNAFPTDEDRKYFTVMKHSSQAQVYNKAKGKEIYVLRRTGDISDAVKCSVLLRMMRLEPHERILSIFDRTRAPASLMRDRSFDYNK